MSLRVYDRWSSFQYAWSRYLPSVPCLWKLASSVQVVVDTYSIRLQELRGTLGFARALPRWTASAPEGAARLGQREIRPCQSFLVI